ncbi:hypothetical protein NQ317_018282 [Molorchus minor]|uniref:C2H2-type domain-containing protein n=1 Tax=Molorchus minor TaxID=1323400 RepID=A0ABQ9K6R7_9CUCU|nr:hypothetical protein NQ317_018282 [Molorchus minor]
MSPARSRRKRSLKVPSKCAENPKKKIKTKLENEENPQETGKQSKQPMTAPNGKLFYSCQFCYKVFPNKTTSITHMKKCPDKSNAKLLDKDIAQNGPNINNNMEQTKEGDKKIEETVEDKAEPRIKITQNIRVQTAEPEKTVDPASVYDYDEEDEKPDDGGFKENDEDAANNRLCKHCKTIFDNPLELLRHTRDCHSFPRTILPPEEIEKYFDSPNREFCPICEKPIKTRNFRSVFIKHLLVHTTGLTHECKVCKKKFRRRDHMRAHEKRHIISG